MLAGGGTGGHVYPGLAVVGALRTMSAARGQALDLQYVGIRGRVDEQIVPAAGIPFRAIDAGQLRVGSPVAFARNLLRLVRGVAQAWGIIGAFRPQVVFATGGYASVPVGVAAKLRRTPLVVYLPDVTPGWAVRLLARLATRMATTSERALPHLPRDRTSVVGYPVRERFWSLDRAAARAALRLPAEGRVLLVTAGSLGARTINDAVFAGLPALLTAAHVVHITGAGDEARALSMRSSLTPEQQARYHVHAYYDDMPAAMHAADLVVSRAGASSLGELPAAGAAAILVPGEYEGWSQAPNAEFLQDHGAAVLLRNAGLDRLGETVLALLADDARLDGMATEMRGLARPHAAEELAALLVEVAA